MRSVDFYKLSRSVQERFLSGASGASAPQRWLRLPPRARIPWGWILAGLAAAGVLTGLLTLGYGTAGNRLALAPLYMMAVYGAAVWMIAICIMGALSFVSAPGWLPYRTGVYLFPIGVVEANSVRLVVHPFSGLEKAEAPNKTRLVLRFKGGRTFAFPIPSADKAEPLVEAVNQARDQVAQLEADGNAHDLATLDPLIDTGIPSPLLPTQPLVRQVPEWSRYALLIALAPALGLAWPIWHIRNVMSEEAMYDTAVAADSPEAYRAYIATGGKRREVADLLLPRAELRVARESGSIPAVEAVVAKYEGTQVHAEFEAVLRELLLGELAKAREEGSLKALRNLNRGFSRGDLIEIELEAALHEVYTKALKRFEKQAARGRAEVMPFFEKLLAHAEKKGPKIEIRFRRELRGTVETADKRVRKSEQYAGRKFIPSQYFGPKHAASREKRIADQVIARFDRVFSHEILQVEVGKPLEQDQPLPAVQVPTLFVTHATLMSGTYVNRAPVGVYVGVGVLFEASFRLPGRSDSIDYRLSVWRQPNVDIIKSEKLEPEQVYDQLAGEAFDRYAEKFLARIFKD